MKLVIEVTPLPTVAGEPPPEQRMKRWLKCGLRDFRLRAKWPQAPRDAGNGPRTRLNDSDPVEAQ